TSFDVEPHAYKVKGLPEGISSKVRPDRVPETKRDKAVKSNSASMECHSLVDSGYFCMQLLSPSCGSVCQISSVIKGRNGCSKRIDVSNVSRSVRLALFASVESPWSSAGFINSRYQSQYSCQKN